MSKYKKLCVVVFFGGFWKQYIKLNMSSNETGYTFCVCFCYNSFYDDGIKKPIFMNIQHGGYEVVLPSFLVHSTMFYLVAKQTIYCFTTQ